MEAGSLAGGAEIILVLLILLVLFVLPLIPGLFYLITLQKAFGRCRPRNRLMDPALVWLMVIPLFNIIWHFVIVINLAGTLSKEFRDRGLSIEREPGQALGLATCVLVLCGMVPYLGFITSLAALVCWICYWVKIANFSNQLAFEPWKTTPDPLEEANGPAARSAYRTNLYNNRRDRVTPDWR